MTSRLERSELLEHPTRTAIYDIVCREPGIPFLALFDRLKPLPTVSPGLGYGSLAHHLHQLERFGLLTNRRSGRHRRYYQNGGPWDGSTTALSVLQIASVSRIARLLLDAPGASQQELHRRYLARAHCTRQILGYHLARLEKLELIVVARNGHFKLHYPTERLQQLMTWAVRDASPVEVAASTPPLVAALVPTA